MGYDLYLLFFSNPECLLSSLYKYIAQLFVGAFLSYIYFDVRSSSLLYDNLNRGPTIDCTKPRFMAAEAMNLGCPYKKPSL